MNVVVNVVDGCSVWNMGSGHGGSTPVQDMQSDLAGLAGVDVVGLPDETVRSELLAALAGLNQLSAYVARLADSFDVRGGAETDGFRTARVWLSAFGRLSPAAASAWLARDRLLRALPALAAAAGRGAVSAEHLAKVQDLASRVGVDKLAPFDEILANLAAAAQPAEVAKACERIAAHLDPDGPDPDPDGAFDRRELTLSRQGSMLYLRGRLDPEGAATLRTALEALMRPPAEGDLRTAGQRRADALIDLAQLPLSAGQLPTVGGVRPSLGILLTPSTLIGHRHTDPDATSDLAAADANTDPATDPDPPPGGEDDVGECDRHPFGLDPLSQAGVPPLPQPAWLDWFGEIPADLAQRLACDASVWRIVLDPATGLPLDVGRAHRLVPPWIRRALHARDRGCRWPGCQAQTDWCDAHHHDKPWYLGGQTNVDELMLLCRWHQVRVHEGQWRIQLDRTTGEVTVYRPDGQPYELGPSRPWTGPAKRRGDPTLPHAA